MGDVDHSGENGNGERATVALVNAKVATVDAKIDGLERLIRSEFKDTQRQLSLVNALDAKVDGQGDRLLLLEGRVTTLERKDVAMIKGQSDSRSYWRDTFPQHLIGVGLFLLAAVQIFIH